MICNLCGHSDNHILYPATIQHVDKTEDWTPFRCTNPGYGSHFTIVKCNICGLVYVNPRIDSKQILSKYKAVEDPLYQAERAGRVLTFERHLIPLHKITGKPNGRRLLDVGCYTGVFVEIAGKAGWDACGVDPSRWAVAEAKKTGLNVIEGTLESVGFVEEQFDVITMWDVIEHLDDPCETLAQAHRLLKKNGIIVIHTMNIDSLISRILGKQWPWYMEMHLYYFSYRTLRKMLEKIRFDVLHTAPQGRFARIEYLVTRLEALIPPIGAAANFLVPRLKLGHIAVPINLGDLFTVYAQKKEIL